MVNLQAAGTLRNTPENGLSSRRLRQVLAHLREDKLAILAGVYLIVLLLGVVLAMPLVNLGVIPDPQHQNLLMRNTAPSLSTSPSFHPLGTDQLGRDLTVRLLYAARISLLVGAATVVISGIVGSTLGVVAGYYRGRVDDVLMRLVDIQMGFPPLLLALLVLYVAGPHFRNVILVLALIRWPLIARVTRSLVLSLREHQSIEAARSIGARDLRIMLRHLLPNVIPIIVVLGILEFARAMLAEAALSFLGMGIQPPDASWGLMLSQGRPYMTSAWWLVALPGMAILFTALSINLLSSWIRTLVDPLVRQPLWKSSK